MLYTAIHFMPGIGSLMQMMRNTFVWALKREKAAEKSKRTASRAFYSMYSGHRFARDYVTCRRSQTASIGGAQANERVSFNVLVIMQRASEDDTSKEDSKSQQNARARERDIVFPALFL